MAVREDGELHTKRHEGSTTVTSSLDAESLTLLSAIQQVAKELRITNMHLAILSDTIIKDSDLNHE